MNQYIYTLQAVREAMHTSPSAEETNSMVAHQAYVQDLMAKGTGIFAGSVLVQDSRHLALVICQAEDDEAAKAIMHNDPAVQNRIMMGRCFPYRVALWNTAAAQSEVDYQHYLFLIQPVRHEMLDTSSEFEDQVVTEHFYYLKDLTEKGLCCLVGRSLNPDYSTFGIAILRAKNDAEAWAISETDPAITHRVMRLVLLPFEITHINTNFGKNK